MKTLTYTRPHDRAGLQSELQNTIPALLPIVVDGEGVAQMRIASRGEDLNVTVPDETDAGEVAAVVAAHDPAPYLAAKQARAEAEAAARTNETILRDEADQALAVLTQRRQNWDSLTPAQKDATNLLVLRAVIALIRLQLRRLEAT